MAARKAVHWEGSHQRHFAIKTVSGEAAGHWALQGADTREVTQVGFWSVKD